VLAGRRTREYNISSLLARRGKAAKELENGWQIGSPVSILFGGFGIDVDN
jgi:hypothetical protein